ncbi:MAG: hypothetical protein IJ400_05675 [Clostridia bacterium]|nr:hypothetical protein [Clostridia bacterium]
MKKIYNYFFILMLILVFCLTSCYVDYNYSSLDEYIEKIEDPRSNSGFSVYEIDDPEYFLPTQSFLRDFEYLEGKYSFYEEDPAKLNGAPTISLIFLKYDEETYALAKECMLEEIPIENEEIYTYGNYKFYRNINFLEIHHYAKVPTFFTMASYNDENHSLCFIGFYEENQGVDDKYINNTKENWTSFIDTYFGEYHDFSE